MLKASKFNGLLSFNSCDAQNSAESFKYIYEILIKERFSLKSEDEIREYAEFKKKENIFSSTVEIFL